MPGFEDDDDGFGSLDGWATAEYPAAPSGAPVIKKARLEGAVANPVRLPAAMLPKGAKQAARPKLLAAQEEHAAPQPQQPPREEGASSRQPSKLAQAGAPDLSTFVLHSGARGTPKVRFAEPDGDAAAPAEAKPAAARGRAEKPAKQGKPPQPPPAAAAALQPLGPQQHSSTQPGGKAGKQRQGPDAAGPPPGAGSRAAAGPPDEDMPPQPPAQADKKKRKHNKHEEAPTAAPSLHAPSNEVPQAPGLNKKSKKRHAAAPEEEPQQRQPGGGGAAEGVAGPGPSSAAQAAKHKLPKAAAAPSGAGEARVNGQGQQQLGGAGGRVQGRRAAAEPPDQQQQEQQEEEQQLHKKKKKKQERQDPAAAGDFGGGLSGAPSSQAPIPAGSKAPAHVAQPPQRPAAGGKGGGGLLEQMRARLAGGRFRSLNEELYTCTGDAAYKMMQTDPSLFEQYHSGFQQQTAGWPQQPLELAAKWLSARPADLVVADFGCGEGRLATIVKQKVHSFDLVSAAPHVVACNMASVPLPAGSVDVAVFSLALMGTDYGLFLQEATRVLRHKGWLWIAEVRSRFAGKDEEGGGGDSTKARELQPFLKCLARLGFSQVSLDTTSNTMFFVAVLRKLNTPSVDLAQHQQALPWPELKACVYKKR